MYVLRSKKTGIYCGWSAVLWGTGGFEIVDDESGSPTPPKVLGAIHSVTGLNLTSSGPTEAAASSAPSSPTAVLQPDEPPKAPQTFVTDPADPANVPQGLFAGDDDGGAEDDS